MRTGVVLGILGALAGVTASAYAFLIYMINGLNGTDVATLEQLAGELGVTRERVRQIQAEALDKLRARLRVRGLSRDALL